MEAPEFFIGGYFGGDSHFSSENRYFDQKLAENNNHFTVDDLLDFSKADEVMTDAFFDNVTANSTDSSTVTIVDSCNSSVSGNEPQFSGNNSFRNFPDPKFSSELCVPYDDLAELEWLSTFVEDSFSGDDFPSLQLISTPNAPLDTSSSEALNEFRAETTPNRPNPPIFDSNVSVPGKARSKRSRAAPCDWSSRLLVLTQSEPNRITTTTKTTPSKKRDNSTGAETPARRCLHCASEKTPQWRTGPMGPKTLCNACGVRFKSGRLVPEYRPAASPTFVSAKHSNSHRKVLELRRQKEIQSHHHHQQQQFLSQSSIFGVSNGAEFLINNQSGPHYRHVM